MQMNTRWLDVPENIICSIKHYISIFLRQLKEQHCIFTVSMVDYRAEPPVPPASILYVQKHTRRIPFLLN